MLTSTTPCPRLHQQPQKSGTTCWLQLRDSKMGMGQSFKTTNHIQPDPTSRSWACSTVNQTIFGCRHSQYYRMPRYSPHCPTWQGCQTLPADLLLRPSLNPWTQLCNSTEGSSVPAFQRSSFPVPFKFWGLSLPNKRRTTPKPRAWDPTVTAVGNMCMYVCVYIYDIISYHIICLDMAHVAYMYICIQTILQQQD